MHHTRGRSLKKREIIGLDKGWRYSKGNHDGAQEVQFDDSRWRILNVPHDWSIEEAFDPDMENGGTQGYLPRCTVGWYRKTFRLPSDLRAKNISILFDGVHQYSKVWINGVYLGQRPYGYVSFEYDLTPYLVWEGENVIAVKVDNTSPLMDRWYSGSGIYRHVWLIATEPLHVKTWGTYVTTSQVSPGSALIHVQTEVENKYEQPAACEVLTQVKDEIGHVLMEEKQPCSLQGGEIGTLKQTLKLSNPKLWSPDKPNLYEVHTSISVGGAVADDYITSMGIREVVLDNDNGLLLNGKPLKLKGVCIHHDLGCLGAAYHDTAMKRRLETLKELGCNAIRFAHNPMAPELLNLCDQMGFLVISEAFDKWESLSYEPLFDEWWEKDLDAMLLRDRNHPSIFMWSVGNEVENQGQDSMLEMLDKLVKHCRKVDSSRPVTCALEPHNWPLSLRHGSMEEKVAHTKKFADKVDILGLNYQEQWYDQYRAAMPHMLIVGTETFPFFRGKGNQIKSYEPMNPWFDVANKPYVIGQFIWAGIDYLGESEYPSKGWSSGLIDTCGFRKPISYLQQSLWSDKPFVQMAVFDESMRQSHNPSWTLHWKSPQLATHWTFPHYEGKLVRMVTFTNCESVELFVNDEFVGEKYLSDFPDHMMVWYLPYTPGKIRAVGKNGGQAVSSHEMVTAGKPQRLRLKADRTELAADGYDIAHIEVTITDQEGVVVPNAEHEVIFELQGDGVILGVDNGDLNSDEPYKGKKRKAYFGKCLVIVQSGESAGTIRLQASSQGLEEDVVVLVAKNQSMAADNIG